MTGACCNAVGGRFIASNSGGNGCTGPNSFRGAGTTCFASPCPALLGRCCSAVGTCTVTIQSGCLSPSSFTGEDVVELHCHGGRFVADAVLAAAYRFGARAAEAGEFSLRAFLNDKIDLLQAEAIADLVASGSARAARAAVRSLEGEFSAAVTALQSGLTALRVRIEAWLDFPDEELPFGSGPSDGPGNPLLESVVAASGASAVALGIDGEARSGAHATHDAQINGSSQDARTLHGKTTIRATFHGARALSPRFVRHRAQPAAPPLLPGIVHSAQSRFRDFTPPR